MSDQKTQTNEAPVVHLSIGAGTTPIDVEWMDGDTVATVLERAGVVVEAGKTPTLGKVRVKNPKTTLVQPGEVIVVTGKPSNG